MIIKREWCVTCGTKEDLMKITHRNNVNGDVVQYFICRPDNAIKRSKYYYANKKKVMEANARYAKKK